MPTSIEQPFELNNKIKKNGLKKVILFALGAFIFQLGSFYATQVNPHATNTYALPIALWCASLFFVGRQYWPIVLCTSFISLIAFKTPVAVAALYAVTLTVGTFAIVKIDRAFYKRPLTVTTLSDILRIALISVALGALAALMSAVGEIPFGNMTLTTSIETGMFVFERVALRCFLAFPALIIWSTLPKSWANSDSMIKLIFFICVWTAVSYPMFFSATSGATAYFERGYFIFVLTPFVGLYLGAHGIALSTALLYSFALVGSFFTTGGFYQSDTLDFTQLRVFMTCHAISGLVTIVVIDLLKKQKERYTTTEEVFRKAIDEIPIPIAVLNSNADSDTLVDETRVQHVNSRFTEQTGYTGNEIPDLGTWWHLAYPDQAYRNTIVDRWKAWSTDPNVPSNMESWVHCRDGSKKLMRWGSFSVGDRVLSCGQDLTQAYQQQNSLKIAASLYQAIGAMVAITDESNKIIAVNPAFQQEIGYTEQELLNLGITSFISIDSETESFDTIWQQLTHQDHFEGEIQIHPSQQAPVLRHLSIYLSPVAFSDTIQRIWLFSEPTDAKRARAETQRQAQYDPLTGLANRRLLTSRLEAAITRASQNQSEFCLIFIDLDDFKDINDTRGHDIGDDVLVAVSNRLQRLQRNNDTTARLGGDEFTLIYNDIISDSQLETRISLLLKEFEQPFNIKNSVYQLSVSVGVAQYPRDGQTSREILMHADQAMYAAKRDGKGRHKLFDQSLQQQATEKQLTISEIRKAIDQQEFELYFQPIVTLGAQRIVKAEALLRWNFPERPMRMPATFLEHAESSGLILPLGAWVFTQAVQACHQFNQVKPGFSVALNVSPTQLSAREDQTRGWIKELKDREVDPMLLDLEITEQVMLHPSALVRTRIEHLKKAGFQFSVDDFGVGYSSLAVLQTTQFNYLKIDRHFVSTLDTTPTSQAVVRAIIELAHGLHMQAIAEGIETPLQLEVLKQLGCDLGQGYLLHRPMTQDQLHELLKSREAQY